MFEFFHRGQPGQGRAARGPNRWDWVLLHDGPQLWRQAAPRTNLRLTDAQGYDIPNDPDNLFRLVDSVSGWRHEVARALRAAGVS